MLVTVPWLVSHSSFVSWLDVDYNYWSRMSKRLVAVEGKGKTVGVSVLFHSYSFAVGSADLAQPRLSYYFENSAVAGAEEFGIPSSVTGLVAIEVS